MRWAGLGLAGMMIVGLMGCNSRGAQFVQSAGPSDTGTQPIAKSKQIETPADSPVLIVTIQSRDHFVKIYSGDRYTVEDTEGQWVAELVTEDEFKQLLPGVFARVNEALADNAWAGL